MKLSEGNVFGEKYYTVDPNVSGDPYWYHQDWHDMENWCIKTFGVTPKDGVWTPNARWYMNNSKFWFRNKKDLEWFIIRWT
jgi:hypothetical protein